MFRVEKRAYCNAPPLGVSSEAEHMTSATDYPATYQPREGITLYRGDCLAILPTLTGVDAVVTDPPYSEITHSGARTLRAGARSGVLVDFASFDGDAFLVMARALVDVSAGWVVMFCDWHHAALLEPAGLPLVRLGVWVKPNGAPQLTGDRPATGWESIAILHRPGAKVWNGGGSRAVWTCNRVDAANHPTEKPVKLLHNLVDLFAPEGATVLDPYMGSGTTGIACIRTGRRFIGIEIDPTHYATACRRIDDELQQIKLDI